MSSDLETRHVEYTAAFNSKDFGLLTSWLDENLLFEWGDDMPDLVGRDAFFASYRVAWVHFDERISARIITSGDDMLTRGSTTASRFSKNGPTARASRFDSLGRARFTR